MPFENPQAESAPTRRSSRLRTQAHEATAVGETATASASPAATETSAPLSRRAARMLAAEAIAADESVEKIAAPDEVVSELGESTPKPAKVPLVVSDEPIIIDGPAIPAPTENLIDAFEQASQAFKGSAFHRATASVPVEKSSIEEIVHLAPRRSGRIRKVVTVGASLGVMSLAGLLAVSMTLPAEALAAVQGTSAASASLVAPAAADEKSAASDEIQAFVTSSDVQNEALDRGDDFSTISLVEVAAEQGINYSNEVFTNDPEAAIQWPFLVGVGMSYGYGMRSGRLHEGIDFVPGNGAPVQAIADGTVRLATEQGGAYGVTVYIDHVIDGEVITSHYAHMQYDSLQVKTGDKVTVGTVIGKTGNTGRSYGAHMHFELIVNGSTIDPLPWLKANAGRYEY
ncbi:M23 family metallopeptidase [Microbacterium sp. kSW2-24]|nr:M23 family metallopeptidase [Microbacterium galbinum]MCK2029323.1 M23 family metallopeptidase [Microbacterium galbinum]